MSRKVIHRRCRKWSTFVILFLGKKIKFKKMEEKWECRNRKIYTLVQGSLDMDKGKNILLAAIIQTLFNKVRTKLISCKKACPKIREQNKIY